MGKTRTPTKTAVPRLAGDAFSAGLPGAEAGADFMARQQRNAKWQRLADHSATDNPNDWRLAILEADLLLEDLLDMKHAFGDTLGDKLKSMTTGDMPSIRKAWDAHMVRNHIAHQGSDFVLTQREARRIIGLYEDVLREGGFIS